MKKGINEIKKIFYIDGLVFDDDIEKIKSKLKKDEVAIVYYTEKPYIIYNGIEHKVLIVEGE